MPRQCSVGQPRPPTRSRPLLVQRWTGARLLPSERPRLSRSGIEAWFAGLDAPADLYEEADWRDARASQFGHAALHSQWASRFRFAYHAGVVLILGALVAILIPPGEIKALRGLAIAVASLATVGEAAWIAATELSYHWGPDDPPKPPLLRRVVRLIVPPYRPITPPDLVAAPAAPPPTPPDDAPVAGS